MQRYNIDKVAPSWFKIDRHIIILYEEDAYITRYISLIYQVFSFTSNIVFNVM